MAPWTKTRILPTKIKQFLYDALFFPYLPCCHVIWGTTPIQNSINKLLLSQKKAIRIIANVSWNAPINTYFKDVNIPRVNDLYNYRLFCIYGGALRLKKYYTAPSVQKNKCIHNSSHNTRYSLKWMVPKVRTLCGNQSSAYDFPVLLGQLACKNIKPETLTNKSLMEALITLY